MMTRTRNPNTSDYKNYMGRGISASKRWQQSENFILDMEGTYFDGAMLDRIDNDKGYSKENCRWTTRTEQNRNRRNTKNLTFRGKTKSLPEWADELGIRKSTLRQRLYVYGWSVEKCLTTPIRTRTEA